MKKLDKGIQILIAAVLTTVLLLYCFFLFLLPKIINSPKNITKIEKSLDAIIKAIENPNVFVYLMYINHKQGAWKGYSGREIKLEDVREMSIMRIMSAIRSDVHGEFITIEGRAKA